jgi:hypothetical protein
MIALCLIHAAQADEDRFTIEQCREMKRNPFVKNQNINEFYGYLRKNTVFHFGNFAYNVRNILVIGNTPVIFFRKDLEEYDRLNLFIVDRNQNPLLLMNDNFWTVFQKNLLDLRCSTRGRELEVRFNDGQTNLFLRFDDVSNSQFRSLFSENSYVDMFLQGMNNPDSIPMWTVLGTLTWGQVKMEITESQVT